MHIHSIDLCLSSLTGRSLLSSPKLSDDDDDIALQSNETYMEMSSGLLENTVDSNVNQNKLETLSEDLHLSDSSTTTSSSSEEEEPYTDDVIIPGRSNKRKLKDITEEEEEADEIKKNRKYWHMDLNPNSEHDRPFWNIIHGEEDIMARLMTKEDYQKYVHEAIGWID